MSNRTIINMVTAIYYQIKQSGEYMYIQAITTTNSNLGVTKNSKHNNPNFKAKVFCSKDGIEHFIKCTKQDSVETRKMFSQIVDYLTSIKSKYLEFKVQEYKSDNGALNIQSRFNLNPAQRKGLAIKYNNLLTRKEYEKMCSTDYCKSHYLEIDLEKPLMIYNRPFDSTNLTLKTFPRDIEEALPESEAEKLILLKSIRRPHNIFKKVIRWLDTHGPNEPPIY